MYYDNKIWIGESSGEKICILPKMANRHGLIAGATGTGKTITLKVLAESFSDAGVPVFLADVKGDLSGMIAPGKNSADIQTRIHQLGLDIAGFDYRSYPTNFWDIFQQGGIPLRTTISEMGPLLLSRLLGLNETQSDILTIVFKIADDEGLLLYDIKDLKALLQYIGEHNKDYAQDYGNIAKVSIGAILRNVVALEGAGGDMFFFEPGLDINDWFMTTSDGKGMINILDCRRLINDGTMYSTFLLWMLSELFEHLPEVGDPEKPRMVFFFDEAHLLFKNMSKVLRDKIEQVVKLIRSKGVGIYFITQSPKDLPDEILSQLGNKIQHALHAYTPSEQKVIKAAAAAFRENPEFKTADILPNLGVGEALISVLDEDGIPSIVKQCRILPPQSLMGSISESERQQNIRISNHYLKYKDAKDPESAYEILNRLTLAEAESKHNAEIEREKAKAAEKAAAAEAKAAQRDASKAQAARKRAIKSVAGSVTGTVGREIGKSMGSNFGSLGKKVGGNVGASLGRNILGTLFKF